MLGFGFNIGTIASQGTGGGGGSPGGGGDGLPHLAWRIYCEQTFDDTLSVGQFSIAEIRLRETVGGSYITFDADTATGSSQNGSEGPRRAFDSIEGNHWTTEYAQAPSDQWCAVTLNTPTVVNEVRIMPQGEWWKCVAVGKVQSSDDSGATWQDQWSFDFSHILPEPIGYVQYLDTQRPGMEPEIETPEPHLYWRVEMEPYPGNFLAAAEVGLREYVGGPNIAKGGTASANSIYDPAYAASKAFDGREDTFWHAENIGIGWVQYQFAEPVGIAEVSVRGRLGSSATQTGPKGRLLYSDNGTDFTEAFEWGDLEPESAFSNGEVRSYSAPNPDAHRYWRIYATGNTSGYYGARELQFIDPNGDNLATDGSKAVASSTYPGEPVSNCFDGTSTVWTSNATGDPFGWVSYDFTDPVEIATIIIASRADIGFAGQHTMRTGVVQWSDDNSTWADAFEFGEHSSTPGWTQNDARRYPPLPVDDTQYWRVSFRQSGGGSFQVGEMEMRETVSGADACTGGTPDADNSYGGEFVAASAFDNTNATRFATPNSIGAWLAYTFAAPLTIEEIALTQATADVGTTPWQGAVEFSLDAGVTWNVHYYYGELADGDFSSAEQRVYSA